MCVHADAWCLPPHVCPLCYSVWNTPSCLILGSGSLVMFELHITSWNLHEAQSCTILSTWFRESLELEVWFMRGRWLCLLDVSIAPTKDKTAESAALTGWFPAELRIWLTPQPEPAPFSDQSHDAALAWEWHLGAGGLLWIKSHSLATHGVAVVCLNHVFTTSLKIIVNICWIWYPNLNIRKIELLWSTAP